jgi:putative modified peptide
MKDGRQIDSRTLENLLDRWMNDPSFKEQFQSDPEAALRSCGIEATDEIIKAMKMAGSNASVESLRDRIVKGTG